MTGRPSEPLDGADPVDGGKVSDPPPDSGDPAHRAGAKAVVTAGETVLLVRERHSDGSVFWTLPGGGVETDETVREALRREIREELRCDCALGRQLAACVYDHRHLPVKTVYAILSAELEAVPRPNPSEGIVDHEWKHPANLPPATLEPIRDTLERLPLTR